MKTQKSHNSIEINRNDMVLIIGESMGSNSAESLRFAQHLAAEGKHGNVLFINSFQRPHKFQLTVKQTLGSEYDLNNNSDGLGYLSYIAGSLADHCSAIESKLQQGANTIVINCWELSARDSRLKERLLYSILNWLHVYTATIILYAQKSSSIPKPGYAQRGGFGKLAGVADQVIPTYEEETQLQESKPSTQALAKTDLLPEPEKQPAHTIANTTLSASGYEEIYDEFSAEIDEADPLFKAWDQLGISRSEARVYFYGNPKNSKFTQLVEERMTKKRIHCRSAMVSPVDYDFPETVPLERSPEVGVSLEAYLARYRKQPKGSSVNVQNDVIEMKEVTGQVLRLAA